MSERIHPGSPAQEFYDLAKLYVKHFGEQSRYGGRVTVRQAKLGRLAIYSNPDNGWLQVEHLPPCAAQYEVVWSNAEGFNTLDWYQHLEALRKVLILERLAAIDAPLDK